MMKINVNEIPKVGMSLKESFEPVSLDIDTDQIKLSGPVDIRAEVTMDSENVYVDVSIQGVMRITCSRCLADSDRVISKDFHLCYELSESIIDLTGDIRQEIILDYPIKVLCKDDCKGLCPHCGQNLNEMVCDCKLK